MTIQNFKMFSTFGQALDQMQASGSDLNAEQKSLIFTYHSFRAQAVDNSPQAMAKTAAFVKCLEPYLVEDPKIVVVDKKPDMTHTIFGHSYLFKIDTGSATSVLDARNIVWAARDDKTQADVLTTAYSEYVLEYPDRGPLTKEYLKEPLDFGVVEKFDLVIHENGHDPILDAQMNCRDIIETIECVSPVVGISNPKVKGERQGLRPVIAVDVIVNGADNATKSNFALNKRELTRRGLLSRDFLAENGITIAFGEQSNKILPLKLLQDESFCNQIKNILT